MRSSGTIVFRRSAAASGPATAPALSMARWRPKARPRVAGETSEAISASRGAVRIPLPTRSANRIARTCTQPVARPISGRTRAAIE